MVETALTNSIGSSADFAFDLTDLIVYFKDNRAPTGVQRVQTELVLAALNDAPGRSVATCYLESRNDWVTVDPGSLRELIVISRRNGGVEDPTWTDAYETFSEEVRRGVSTAFSADTVLVSLGTSWWLSDYFLRVRTLKARHGVRLATLFYDIIPLICPGDVAPALMHRFTEWVVGAIRHTDVFLAISNATRDDVIATAARIGRTIDANAFRVLPLNISFIDQPDPGFRMQPGRVASGRYVLFVSTIERRKNQSLALSAWRSLINKHGIDRVPQLVLVGKMGYGSEQVSRQLANDDQLRRRVTILSGIEDDVLADLYRGCMFTIYPSGYEGWGLPITESLSFHRAVLSADNSSLPEAGGDLAVYFGTGSSQAFERGIETLIFDEKARREVEARIAREFVNGSWSDLMVSLMTHVVGQIGQGAQPATGDRLISPQSYYSLQSHAPGPLFPGINIGEVFRLGGGWFPLETWGVWTYLGGGWLHFDTVDDRPVTIAFRVRGLPGKETMALLLGRGGTLLGQAEVAGDTERWITVTVTPVDGAIDIGLTAPDSATVGGDKRRFGVGLIGFFVIGEDAVSRTLVEAVALGNLNDHNPFRNPALGAAAALN